MKTRIIYTMILIAMSAGATRALPLQWDGVQSWDTQNEYVNQPFGTAGATRALPLQWDDVQSTQSFLFQSELFYSEELSFLNNFSGGDFLTFRLGGLSRDFGDDETIGDGGYTSNNDHLFYANDVPLGDGALPLLLAALGWIMMVGAGRALPLLVWRFCHCGARRNPGTTVKQPLTDIRGLRVKPAMTAISNKQKQ